MGEICPDDGQLPPLDTIMIDANDSNKVVQINIEKDLDVRVEPIVFLKESTDAFASGNVNMTDIDSPSYATYRTSTPKTTPYVKR